MTFKHNLFFFFTLLLLIAAQTTQAQWTKVAGFSVGKINTLTPKGQVLYAGTDTGGVFASTDFGLSWAAKSTGLTNKSIAALVLKDSVFIAGLGNGFGGAISLSKNQGNTWANPTNNYFGFLFCLAQQGNDVLAGTWYGVAKSTNNGDSWATLPTVGLPSNASVTALLANGNTIFACVSSSSAGGTGVFRSTDNGDNWTKKSTGIVNNNFKAMVQTGTTLLVATNGGGIYASTNNGDSWATANSGLTNLMVQHLYANGSNLLAATAEGVFLSNDNAATWTDISTGLPTGTIVRSITAAGSFLVIGTDSAVWRRQTSEVITGIPSTPNTATLAVYPNPSNGHFTIELPANTQHISVTNTLGQTVYQSGGAALLNNTLNLALPADAKGVYFIQLKTPDGTVAQKILVE